MVYLIVQSDIMEDDKYITVSRFNAVVKNLMSKALNLDDVYIKGEVSNLKKSLSGHYYFTIKDEKSSIEAIIFANYYRKLDFEIENGMKVLVRGKVSIYLPQGKYQIEVRELKEDGLGNLFIAYNQLKKKLEAEGHFRDEIKKDIPKFPQRIGVVTAKTGAAIRDIITIIERRWQYCQILVFPSLVQGKGSAENIARQIKRSEGYNLDTLIVGRGGGSIEDLWSFNEEIVARAIIECKTPVISAVGHEVDFTIADFVADLRAPTPTAAGELAVPDYREIEKHLNQLNIRLEKAIKKDLDSYSKRLNQIKSRSIFVNPEEIYQMSELSLDILKEKLNNNCSNLIRDKENQLDRIKSRDMIRNPYKILLAKEHRQQELIAKLEALNPILTLKRGYAYARKDGKIVSKAADLKKGDNLKLTFDDGNVNTKVID